MIKIFFNYSSLPRNILAKYQFNPQIKLSHFQPLKITATVDMESATTSDPMSEKDGGPKGTGEVLSKRQLKRLRREEMRQSKKKPKKRKITTSNLIHEDKMSETSYYYENGLRKVYPYYFTYTTHAKERWYGKTLLEVFAKEFYSHTTEDYEKAIKTGKVLVNHKKIDTDYKLKDNDLVTNLVHRHELPVTAERLNICYEDEHVVVVDKPSSIPIHPCGRFRHNSLTYILAREFNFPNLRSIYRLDRLTSGLYIMCKDETTTKTMQIDIRERRVHKEYICRVVGQFPEEEVVCEEPMDVLNHLLSVYGVRADGKEAKTTFNRVHYDGSCSIVKCRPHTGRTHQIRVHLQYLGHPIVNDPLYNTEVWGPQRGKGGQFGKSLEQLLDEMRAYHNSHNFLREENPTCESKSEIQGENPNENIVHSPNSVVPDSNKCEETTIKDENATERVLSNSDREAREDCDITVNVCSSNDSTGAQFSLLDSGLEPLDPSKHCVVDDCPSCTVNYRDPLPSELIMYLHAYKYKGPSWEYNTPLPVWADPSWTP